MRLLFDDALHPITSEIGFIEAPCARAVAEFVNWQAPLHQMRGVVLREKELRGSLREVLASLLPLTSVERRRYLFVPTSGVWTAFFDNGHQGTDMGAAYHLATLIRCRALRVAAIPNTMPQRATKAPRGRYGAIIFEVHGAELKDQRALAVTNDGGRWVFDQSGSPLPFETPHRYQERRLRKRFTFEMLCEYAAALGLHPFEEEFYMPSSDPIAHLVEKVGPKYAASKEYTLSEAAQP
jgi:hypothetical protein